MQHSMTETETAEDAYKAVGAAHTHMTTAAGRKTRSLADRRRNVDKL